METVAFCAWKDGFIGDNQALTDRGIFLCICGSLVGVYFPDYMDGIQIPGWHLHFLSEDRTKGGHVFDACLRKGTARIDKITSIEIELPKDASFDTYSLKQDLMAEIESVE